MEFQEESVQFNPNDDFTTRIITHINNRPIYQINVDDCPRYISPLPNIEYIGTIFNGKFHIFKLRDGEIPAEFQERFAHIDETAITVLSGKQSSDESQEIIVLLNRIPKFKFITNYNFKCIDLKNLTAAKGIVDILNADLHRTCPDFRINVDYVFALDDPSLVTAYTLPPKPTTILICLFKENNCVSSLELEKDSIVSNQIEISSLTLKSYERRQFNKLLRAVIILIAKAIEPTTEKVGSIAINPISAFIMLNFFNAEYTNRENKISLDKNSTFDDVKLAMTSVSSIWTSIILNDENIQNAMRVFNETIDKVNCGPLEPLDVIAKGTKRKTKTKNKTRTKTKTKK